MRMNELAERLEKKGYSKKDASKTLKIIQNARAQGSKNHGFLYRHVFAVTLVTMIAGNFAIAFALVPAFIALKGIALYSVLFVTAITFGLMANLLIKTLETEKKHHIFLAFFLPLTAFANAYININSAIGINLALKTKPLSNPVFISIFYAISFSLPYFIYKMKEYFGRR